MPFFLMLQLIMTELNIVQGNVICKSWCKPVVIQTFFLALTIIIEIMYILICKQNSSPG